MFKTEGSLKSFLYRFYYKVKTELNNLNLAADGLSGHASLEESVVRISAWLPVYWKPL